MIADESIVYCLVEISSKLESIKAELREINSKLSANPTVTKTDGGYDITVPLSATGYKEFGGFCKEVCDSIAELEKAGIDPRAPHDPATRHVPRAYDHPLGR